MSYQVEIIERKDPVNQLEASKSSIKDLFSNLLNERKGFKYQITQKVLLKKYKTDGETECRPVNFNSTTKTVINHKFKLESSFQEILYLNDNTINEGSGWIVESIESHYIDISTYRFLSRISYVGLPVELKSSKKGLINIKNNGQRFFFWCHVRHINPIKIHPGITTKEDKNLLKILIMIKLNFLCKKKILARLKQKIIFALMCLVTKMD